MIALKTAKFVVKSCRSLGRVRSLTNQFDNFRFQILIVHWMKWGVKSATAQLTGSMPANQLHFPCAACQLCMELRGFFPYFNSNLKLNFNPITEIGVMKAAKYGLPWTWSHETLSPCKSIICLGLYSPPSSNISTRLLLIIKSNTWVESN